MTDQEFETLSYWISRDCHTMTLNLTDFIEFLVKKYGKTKIVKACAQIRKARMLEMKGKHNMCISTAFARSHPS